MTPEQIDREEDERLLRMAKAASAATPHVRISKQKLRANAGISSASGPMILLAFLMHYAVTSLCLRVKR